MDWLKISLYLYCAYLPLVFAAPLDTLAPGHWYEIQNTRLTAIDPANSPAYNPNFPSGSPWAGLEGQRGVMTAWNGGAFDTLRNRLIVWGGGHNGYGGNEVYAFDVDVQTWSMLHAPQPDMDGYLPSFTYGLLKDWTPSTTHTYDLPVYAANIDGMLFARSGWFGGGRFSTAPSGASLGKLETQVFSFQNNQWETEVARARVRQPNGGFGQEAGAAAVYDSINGVVWRLGRGSGSHLEKYDPIADQWTDYGNAQFDYYRSVLFDFQRARIVVTGVRDGNFRGTNGDTRVIDVSNPNAPSGLIPQVTTGVKTAENAKDIGFEYDSAADRYVAWIGNQQGSNLSDVYVLDPVTWVWARTPAAPTNTVTPTPGQVNGTWGRFSYVASKNIYVLVNAVDQNVFAYRLSNQPSVPAPPPPTPPPPVNDTTPPSLSSLIVNTSQELIVRFSEPLDTTTAGAASNYSINGGVSVISAATFGDSSQVLLGVTGLAEADYILTVNNVFDQAAVPNEIAANSQIGFTYSAASVPPPGPNPVPTEMTPANYQWGVLTVGSTVYVDRDYTFSFVSPELVGLDYILTANDDKFQTGNSFVAFSVAQDVTVYVAFDVRADVLPGWLQSWSATGLVIETTDSSMDVYEKAFAAGTVELGGNAMGFSNYSVMVAFAEESTGGAGSGGTGGSTGGSNDGTSGDAPSGDPTVQGADASGGGGGALGSWMLLLLVIAGLLKQSVKRYSGLRQNCGVTDSVKKLAVFVLVVLAVQPQASWANADSEWFARANASGVTMATRFDVAADVTDWVHNNSNADHLSWQTTGQVSGGGALRFDILNTDVKDSGNWVRWLSDEVNNAYPNGHKEFYAGDTVYVQYRMYVPRYRAEHVFKSGGGWKTSIMSRHNQNMVFPGGVGKAGSNQTNEVVIHNNNHRGLVQGYNQNGKGGFPPWNEGRQTACSKFDIVFQNMIDRGTNPLSGTNPVSGLPWSACEQDRARYGGLFSYYPSGGGTGTFGKPDPLTGAFIWYPDEWITIYFRVDIGDYGVAKSSTINLWAARAGDAAYTHLVQDTMTLGGTGVDNAFDAIWFLPYNTKMAADPTRENTFVLYDELIVSTLPITVPGGTPVPGPPPQPPPVDTTGPQLQSVTADASGVTVTFDEPVDVATAALVANYQIDNSIVVTNAVIQGNGNVVLLATSQLSSGVPYTLTVNNVFDRASSPNVIAANSQMSFAYSAPVTGVDLNPGTYVWGVLALGQDVYVDRNATFTNIPVNYVGLGYIRTANDDKFASGAPFISFGSSDDLNVYVAFDKRAATLPGWLQSWENTGDDIGTSDSSTIFRLYKKAFSTGAVELGGNEMGNSMYAVIVEPQSVVGAGDGAGVVGGSGSGSGSVAADTPAVAADGGGGGGSTGLVSLLLLMMGLCRRRNHAVKLTD